MAVINVTPLTDITALIASDNVKIGDVLLLEEGIYFQSVIIPKDNIRLVAKGPEVVFDGKSTLITAFTLSNVTGVMIEGLTIKHYRSNGIVVDGGFGNRIVRNKIHNMLNFGIVLSNSRSNLIWKNEVFRCNDGIRLSLDSTGNWIIGNLVRECTDDGYETFFGTESHNAFISNKAIKNRAAGFDIFGSNNLLLDNLSVGHEQGVVLGEGNSTVTISNKIQGCKSDAYTIR